MIIPGIFRTERNRGRILGGAPAPIIAPRQMFLEITEKFALNSEEGRVKRSHFDGLMPLRRFDHGLGDPHCHERIIGRDQRLPTVAHAREEMPHLVDEGGP